MADISTWSPTDNSNTAAPPDGWPENQQPSSVNNCARAMMGAVRRWYDTVTAQLASLTTSLGNYVLKSGDTMTGSLQATFLHSTGNVQADNAVTTPYVHAGAAGVLSDGNIGTPGTITGLDIAATRNIAAASGTVTAINLTATSTVTAAQLTSTGNINASVDIAGRDIYIRDVSASRNVTGVYLHSTGNIDAGTYVYAPDGFWAHDAGGGTTYRMYSSGGSSYLQFANFYAFRWDAGSGSLNYIASADIQWVMRTGDFLTYNALAAVGGLGAYINLSDRRGKTDIVPSTKGLDEILRLSPVEFKRVSRVAGQTGMDRRELGFVAQDVQGVLPEAVRVVGMTLPDGTGGLEDAEPSLGITDATIVAALVNAVKELSARLATLEGAR